MVRHELFRDIDFTAHEFKGQLKKFLHNKQKSKQSYQKGTPKPFILHELVMRKVYNPASPLHDTFCGPYRIMELHTQGALLKDPKTGEMLSVHFMNIRKLEIDAFSLFTFFFSSCLMQLCPHQNFKSFSFFLH